MTNTRIITEFDRLWSAAMKRPEGADADAIVSAVSAKLDVSPIEVRRIVLDNNFAEPL